MSGPSLSWATDSAVGLPRFEAEPESRPRVLAAIALDGPSAVALQRADEFSRALGADLHVLHVLAPKRRTLALLGRCNEPPAQVAGSRLAAAVDEVHRFCELMLAQPFPRERVEVNEGGVAEAIVAEANNLDAELIFIGGGIHAGRTPSSWVGHRVLKRAGRPVLIARPRAASNTIVAATDFTDVRFPALARASDLGARLDAPVTFVHNLDWVTRLFMPATAGTLDATLVALPPELKIQVRSRLTELAEGMLGQIDSVVTNRSSSTEAIREIARVRDADLVVVGVHRHSVFRRLGSRSMAEALATSTRRSVLAVPLTRSGVDFVV